MSPKNINTLHFYLQIVIQKSEIAIQLEIISIYVIPVSLCSRSRSEVVTKLKNSIRTTNGYIIFGFLVKCSLGY